MRRHRSVQSGSTACASTTSCVFAIARPGCSGLKVLGCAAAKVSAQLAHHSRQLYSRSVLSCATLCKPGFCEALKMGPKSQPVILPCDAWHPSHTLLFGAGACCASPIQIQCAPYSFVDCTLPCCGHVMTGRHGTPGVMPEPLGKKRRGPDCYRVFLHCCIWTFALWQ